MQSPRLSIIILAAGASERLGRPKQLVLYNGKSLLRRTIDNAESLAPREILVVTGANAEAVRNEAQKTTAKCIHNPAWKNGMGTSIASGALAIEGTADGMMILLCDQWRIVAEDLQQLISAWHADPTLIICSRTNNRCGPPVIFPSSCFQDLHRLGGDSGAHSIIEAHGDLVKPVVLQNAASDLDTPIQLDELHKA